MTWFRFYVEALHDPKVQRLAPADFKLWVNLLCLAKIANGAGRLPDDVQMAYAVRYRPTRLRTALERLAGAGLVHEDCHGWRIHGWEKRQFESDSSTARVKRHRFRNVSSAVTVTAPEAEAETETDTEAEQLAATPHMAAGPEQSPAGARPSVAWLRRVISEYGAGCAEHALAEAREYGAQSLSYAEAIMRRHRAEGCPLPDGEKAARLAAAHRLPGPEAEWLQSRYERARAPG